MSDIWLRIRALGTVESRPNKVMLAVWRSMQFDFSALYPGQVTYQSAWIEQRMHINNVIMLNRGCVMYVRNLLQTGL
jgi:hypothetical protein